MKNTLRLFILARHNKNGILTGTIWNIINFISVFKITDLIDTVFFISNIKLADLTIFLSS